LNALYFLIRTIYIPLAELLNNTLLVLVVLLALLLSCFIHFIVAHVVQGIRYWKQWRLWSWSFFVASLC